MIKDNVIQEKFHWFNEPRHSVENNKLIIQSSPDTDFWQKTHYGFQRDNGHCLLTKVQKDFSVTVRTEFEPENQYDQCGLIVRLNSENWIKMSTEYEDEEHSRLGSVVTNLAYSDWATIDIESKVKEMWYRIQNKENDFLLEYSFDNIRWHQMRIAHLYETFRSLSVGIYSCSPKDSSFTAKFDNFLLTESHW